MKILRKFREIYKVRHQNWDSCLRKTTRVFPIQTQNNTTTIKRHTDKQIWHNKKDIYIIFELDISVECHRSAHKYKWWPKRKKKKKYFNFGMKQPKQFDLSTANRPPISNHSSGSNRPQSNGRRTHKEMQISRANWKMRIYFRKPLLLIFFEDVKFYIRWWYTEKWNLLLITRLLFVLRE